MIIVIGTIILCIIFTLKGYTITINPIKTLYNYPLKIQERVKSSEQYKDKITITKNKLFAKL